MAFPHHHTDPRVYARLAHDAERAMVVRIPAVWVRPAGRILIGLLALAIVVVAKVAHPW
jgi:hypothetical protein